MIAIPHDPMFMPEWIASFLKASATDCDQATANSLQRRIIQSNCQSLANMAYKQHVHAAKTALHSCLAIIYSQRFSFAPTNLDDADVEPILSDIASILERAMLEHEYLHIQKQQTESYPQNGTDFIKWLKNLIAEHPASSHAFYREFMHSSATTEDIRFYFAQETNLDPRFDDILAQLQIGAPEQVKMDIAKNYWDEMGNGNTKNIHSVLFSKALESLQADSPYIAQNMLSESVVSGNLSASMATSRRHRYKALGYFGVTEYITPSRFKHVVKAWRRNNLSAEGIAYHNLHIHIDAVHGNSWFNNVISPMIDENPALGKEIALGALIRLNSSERYLNAVLYHLQAKKLEAEAQESMIDTNEDLQVSAKTAT